MDVQLTFSIGKRNKLVGVFENKRCSLEMVTQSDSKWWTLTILLEQQTTSLQRVKNVAQSIDKLQPRGLKWFIGYFMLLFHMVLFYVSDVDIAVRLVLFPHLFIIFHYIIISWKQFQGQCVVTAVMYVRWVQKRLTCDMSPFQYQVWKHWFGSGIFNRTVCAIANVFAHSSNLQFWQLCFYLFPICLIMIILNCNVHDRWS